MAERMMKELFVEGLQKGKWQYFKEVLKFAIAKMATTETNSTKALDIWAENNDFDECDEDFCNLKYYLSYYLPKERYQAIPYLCELLYLK